MKAQFDHVRARRRRRRRRELGQPPSLSHFRDPFLVISSSYTLCPVLVCPLSSLLLLSLSPPTQKFHSHWKQSKSCFWPFLSPSQSSIPQSSSSLSWGKKKERRDFDAFPEIPSLMGSRIQSHQLSSGLLVSGRGPEHPKERLPTMAARAVPYTGGDVKKSGELGKMFDIPLGDCPPALKHSRPSSSSQHNSGSGQVSKPNSGPVRKTSGPLTPLAPTGLITSGPASGPVGPSGRRSGQLDGTAAPAKTVYGSAVTSLSGEGLRVGWRVSKGVMWVGMVVVAMVVVVGAFLMAAVKKAVILVAVAAVIGPVMLVFAWNYCWRRKGLLGYVKKHPDTELRGSVDGQYVKVTGVVTCGSIPLESSYQKVQRCVYVSTELYEYRGCRGKTAHPKHRFFSWGRRYSEKYVADFYISDFQSGLRALVKAGYGAKIAPFVEPATVVDVTKDNRELSPSFLQWLLERSLSSDDRIMRLKEGYIKEGSTVSVMGIVRRQDNVLMVVPPTEPVSTGCQWLRGFLPTYVEGIILTCEDSQAEEVVNV